MQTGLLNIFESETKHHGPESVLSFDGLLAHLEELCHLQASRRGLFSYTLNRFKKALAKYGCVTPENVAQFSQELYFLYNLFVPLFSDERTMLWGLSLPVSGTVFYGTDAFYRFLKDELVTENIAANIVGMDIETGLIVYRLIFERLYGFPELNTGRLVYKVMREEEPLPRYFEVVLDNRFVNVAAKGKLPEINYEWVKYKNIDQICEEDLRGLLNLEDFIFSGFSIITLQDITHDYVLENVKRLVISGGEYGHEFDQKAIENNLRILMGNPDVRVQITPIFQLNGKPKIDRHLVRGSLLFQYAERIGEDQLNTYLANPYVVGYNIDYELLPTPAFLGSWLPLADVASMAIFPLAYNQQVMGLLELTVNKAEDQQLTRNALSGLRATLPLLTQLVHDIYRDFKAQLDKVILERYTALQPAVQWRFNESAWGYLQQMLHMKEDDTLTEKQPEIRFDDVYPFYGAVDIRDSTLKRNEAILADLAGQLEVLSITFAELKSHTDIPPALEERISDLRQKVIGGQLDDAQATVTDFLNEEVQVFLGEVKAQGTPLAEIIRSYEREMDSVNGSANRHRLAFEQSVSKINAAVNHHLDNFDKALQEIYPSYFDRFRTDGVEFDCYVGQSIAPHVLLTPERLDRIKGLLLRTMVEIALDMRQLTTKLPVALSTTQLIFVNNGRISISFREDERRFDVEGSYNIRYHLIKKRIDKALVKGRNERVTRQGTVAMIYLNDASVLEYMKHVTQLQGDGLIYGEVDHLELEELQGVDGLRAARVWVGD